MSGHEFNAIIAALLLAFGVTVPMPEFIGGISIAFGACFAIMAVRPIEARKGVLVTLMMGGLAGLFAAILHHKTHSVWLWGDLPLQAQMGVAGGFSQAIFEAAFEFGKGMASRAGKIPGSINIPGAGDNGDV